jgi:L-lactate dehydrogenase complex protein LldG
LAKRVFPVYEQVVEKIVADKDKIPSQFTFITGPSMTADIQATAFKGMHGPKYLIVILIG